MIGGEDFYIFPNRKWIGMEARNQDSIIKIHKGFSRKGITTGHTYKKSSHILNTGITLLGYHLLLHLHSGFIR
jgi:hypothetical protein